MHRFWADETGIQGQTAHLAAEDARHAARVLRLEAGDTVELLSGGRRYTARFTRLGLDSAALQVEAELPSTEARVRVTLFQGLPKGDKLELITQKAVELGAAALCPVAMARSVAQLSPRDGEKKRERWQRIAHEACKQSGRCQEMEVSSPLSFQEMLHRLKGFDAVAVPWEEASGKGLTAFTAAHRDAETVALVIGPEGGISPQEIELMRAEGAETLTLGPRILRTETAAIAALSNLLCLYGEMGA